MVRVLFIDDETVLLNAMRMRLRRFKDVWDMRYASSGEEALQLLAAEPVDVVLTDQNMPGLSGTELLDQVRARFPQALRVLISGQSDGAVLHDGLRVAHQFLMKPFSTDELTHAMDRLLALQRSFENAHLKRVVHAVDQLPSPPAVYRELAAALADPDVDLKHVAALAQRDPALSLRLMKLASSAFYASTPVDHVLRAVQRLGLSMVKTAVTYAQMVGAVESTLRDCSAQIESMQQRSLTVANLAQRLLTGPAAAQAYLAGLLHDVGGLVLLAALPEQRAQLFEGDPWPSVRAARERELLGITHAEVDAYLLGTWGQGPSLVRAVEQQHRPVAGEQKLFDVTGAVHVAQRLALEASARLNAQPQRAEYDGAYLTACGQTLPAPTERAFGRDAA